MKDERKTKALLIEELVELRQRVSELEISQSSNKLDMDLAQLQEFHQDIIQNVSEGIVVDDIDGYLTFANSSAERMLGYKSGELEGKHWTEIISSDCHDLVEAADKRRVNGESDRYELELLHKDGSKVPVQVSGSPRYVGGEFAGTMAVFTNIQERVDAEQTLSRSEEKYRLLAENMTDIVWTTDLDFNFTFYSPSVEIVRGFTPEEAISQKIEETITPDSLLSIQEILAEELAAENLTKKDLYRSRLVEVELYCKDGSTIWHEVKFSFLRDPNDEPIGLIGISRDISVRKRTEIAHNHLLAEFEHRNLFLQTAAEVSKSASAILSPDELIQQTVDLIQTRFGYYYVGIFLVNVEGDYAVLNAGTGEAGKQMLKANHRLAVGGESMIGWSVAHAKARIALDAGVEAVRFENPYLPDTRSEMALPLVVHGEAIGALTVQSIEESAFSQEDIAVLQTMTDQLAIAIQNARLFDTAQCEIAERQRAENLLRVLNEAALAMENSFEPDKIFAGFAEVLEKVGFTCAVLPVDFVQQKIFTRYLGFDNKALKAVEKITGRHHKDFSIPIEGAGIMRDVVRKRSTRFLDDLKSPLGDWLPKGGEKSAEKILQLLNISTLITAPMVVEDSVVGVFSVLSEDLKEDDISAITAFANQVAASWRKAELFQQAQIEIEARREAEQQLRLQATALEAAANSIMIALADGTIIWINPAFTKNSGYEPAEIIGRQPNILKSGKHNQEFYKHLWETVLAANVWQGEITNRKKDGSLYTEDTTITPVLDVDGQVTHFVTIKQDITKRKRALEALRASEQKFAKVFHASPNPIALSIFPNGQIVDVNDSFLDVTGYKHEEVVGKTDVDLKLWEETDFRDKIFSDLESNGFVRDIEIGYRRKNGDRGTALFSAEFVQFGADTYLLSAQQDITQRKRAEAEIQLRSQQLAALVQTGQAVASTLELKDVLAQVVDGVPSLVGAEGVSILLLDGPDELVFSAVSQGGVNGVQKGLLGQRMPASAGVAGDVMQSGDPVRINDMRKHDPIYRDLEPLSGFHTQSILAVPLQLGEAIIGVMEAVHSSPDVFSEDDLQMMDAASSWAAIAIGNARQHENIQRRFQESQTVAIISQALTETLDLEEVLQLIGESAFQVIPSTERAVIHLLDDVKQALWPVVAIGLEQLGTPSFNLRVGEGIAGLVITTGNTINVGDVNSDARYLAIGKSTKLNSLMVAPVQSGGRRLGTISIQSADADVFSLEDERMLTTLGFQAAVAIKNARLFEAERQRHSELETLRQASLLITSTLELKPILETILEFVLKLVAADNVHIFQYVDEKLIFGAALWAGEHQEQPYAEPREDGLTYGVARSREKIVVPDFETDPLFQDQNWKGSIIGLPLRIGDQVLGVMNIAYPIPHAFDENEIRVLELLADQAAAALENARLFENERIAREQSEAQATELILRERHLTLLNDITRAAIELSDLPEMLDSIAYQFGLIADADSCYISLWDENRNAPIPSAAYGRWVTNYFNLQVDPDEPTLTKEVLTTLEPMVVQDVSSSNKISQRIVEQLHGRTILALPLILGEQKLGAVLIVYDQERDFDDNLIKRYKQVAGQIALAISKAKLFEETQRRLKEQTALREAASAISSTLDSSVVLNLISEQICQSLNATSVFICSHEIYTGTSTVIAEYVSDEANELEKIPDLGVGYQNVSARFIQLMSQGLTDIAQHDDPNLDEFDREDMVENNVKSILYVPLLVKEQLVGYMEIWESRLRREFSEDEIAIAQGIAQQAAIALENSRLFEAERTRRKEAESIRDATTALTLTIDVQDIVEIILINLKKVVPYDSAACVLLSPDDRWHVVAGRGFPDDVNVVDQYYDANSNQLAQEIVGTGNPIVIADTRSDPRFKQWGQTDYVRGWMGVPLVVRGESIGFLTINSKETDAYNYAQAALAQVFSNQAAVAIENANLFTTTKELADRLVILHQASQGVTGASMDPELIYETVHEAAERLMPCEAFSISILNEDEGVIEGVYLIDKDGRTPELRIPIGEGLSGHVIAIGQPMLVYDLLDTQQFENIDPVNYGSSDSVRALIAVPMKIGEKVIGSLSAQSYQPYQYSPEDQLLLEMLAAHAAVALDNARLFNNTTLRLREVNTLYKIIQEVVASLDVDEILARVVNSLQMDFGYYHVHVYLFDDQREKLVVREGSGLVGGLLKDRGHSLTVDQGLVGYVGRNNEVFLSNNVDELEFFYRNPLLPETSAELAVPLMGREGVMGVLDIQHQAPNIFKEDEMRLISAVADQLSVVLDKAMIYAELQKSLESEQASRSQLVQAGKLTALGRIVASVAHELNNPLQAIQNALYLVKLEQTLSSQSRQDLDVALTETSRMANLIGRLRETYRPITAEEFQPDSLNDVVEDVHHLITTHLRHNNVKFEFHPDSRLPEVKMIRDQMKQVILNLSLNAIENMDQGGELHIGTETFDDDILLSVSDTESGIESQDLVHVFEPFFTTKEGGTGLGLSITYDIVQNHRGRIDIETQPGTGSTFKVWLPK